MAIESLKFGGIDAVLSDEILWRNFVLVETGDPHGHRRLVLMKCCTASREELLFSQITWYIQSGISRWVRCEKPRSFLLISFLIHGWRCECPSHMCDINTGSRNIRITSNKYVRFNTNIREVPRIFFIRELYFPLKIYLIDKLLQLNQSLLKN